MIVLMSLYKIIDKEILIFCFIFVLKTVIQIQLCIVMLLVYTCINKLYVSKA